MTTPMPEPADDAGSSDTAGSGALTETARVLRAYGVGIKGGISGNRVAQRAGLSAETVNRQLRPLRPGQKPIGMDKETIDAIADAVPMPRLELQTAVLTDAGFALSAGRRSRRRRRGRARAAARAQRPRPPHRARRARRADELRPARRAVSAVPNIQLRVHDLMDDAVVVRVGAGVLLTVSRWLHPAQRMVLAAHVASQLHSDRPTPAAQRFPAGTVLGHTRMLADRELAELMDRPRLTLRDAEHVIAALCPDP